MLRIEIDAAEGGTSSTPIVRPAAGAATQTMQALVRFVDCDGPGITRRRCGKGWRYFAPDGSAVTDKAEIRRLNAIALPPAYTNAWYAPDADAHIQATGIDARGRKQYRYHPSFRAERETLKFDRCSAFGLALGRLRKVVAADMATRDLSRARALACVVRLLDTGGIRVGNERYARENKSFGATTLRCRHLKLDGTRAELRFRAKSGKMRRLPLTDRALLQFVRKVQALPGQHLFQYVEGEAVTPVRSDDVNAYIQAAMGDGFTAKDFRTWTASVLALDHVRANPQGSLRQMLAHVAEALGNTPAVVRKSYVHPLLIAMAQRGQDAPPPPDRLPRATRWLSRSERALIALLERDGDAQD